MDGSDRIERSPTPSPSPRGTSEPRFPFGDFPRGWFVVALSDELAPGAPPLSLHYFGRDDLKIKVPEPVANRRPAPIRGGAAMPARR